MALGKQGNYTEGKAYSLKLQLKENGQFLDVAQFAVQEKQGDKYVTTDKVHDVSGDLIKLETRVGEYEGSPIHNVKLALRDSAKNEIYFTEFVLGSNLGRGLANSLLNLKAFDNVQIGLYGQTNKETKKTYPAVALRQGSGDTTVKWKYDPKAEGTPLPGPREYDGKIDPKTKKPKKERDWTETHEFLFAELKEFAKVIEAAAKKSGAKVPADTNTPKTQKTSNNPPQQQENLDEDVPF